MFFQDAILILGTALAGKSLKGEDERKVHTLNNPQQDYRAVREQSVVVVNFCIDILFVLVL